MALFAAAVLISVLSSYSEPVSALPNVTHEWQKNGVNATYAPGYPIKWHTSEVASIGYSVDSWVKWATPSPDEKLIALTYQNETQIFSTDTWKLVDKWVATTDVEKTFFVPNVQGDGYLLGTSTSFTYETFFKTLDKDGKIVPDGKNITLAGDVSWFDTTPFSHSTTNPLFVYFAKNTVQPGYPPRNVSVYDFSLGKDVATLALHNDSIMSTVFSPDDAYLALASWDGTVSVWSTKTWTLFHRYGNTGGQNWKAAWSPDSKYLTVAVGPSAQPPTLALYSISDPDTPGKRLGDFRDWPRSLNWSPDGKLLAGAAQGGKVIYGDPFAPLPPNATVTPPLNYREVDFYYEYEAGDVQWLNGQKRLAYHMGDGTFQIYDLEQNLIYSWEPNRRDLFYYRSPPTALWLPKKGLVGSNDGDGQLRIWKVPE